MRRPMALPRFGRRGNDARGLDSRSPTARLVPLAARGPRHLPRVSAPAVGPRLPLTVPWPGLPARLSVAFPPSVRFSARFALTFASPRQALPLVMPRTLRLAHAAPWAFDGWVPILLSPRIVPAAGSPLAYLPNIAWAIGACPLGIGTQPLPSGSPILPCPNGGAAPMGQPPCWGRILPRGGPRLVVLHPRRPMGRPNPKSSPSSSPSPAKPHALPKATAFASESRSALKALGWPSPFPRPNRSSPTHSAPSCSPSPTCLSGLCVCGLASMPSPDAASLQTPCPQAGVPILPARPWSIFPCLASVPSMPAPSSFLDPPRHIAHAVHGRPPLRRFRGIARRAICPNSPLARFGAESAASRLAPFPQASSPMPAPKHPDGFLGVGRPMLPAPRSSRPLAAPGPVPRPSADSRRDVPFAPTRDRESPANAVQASAPLPAERRRCRACWGNHVVYRCSP